MFGIGDLGPNLIAGVARDDRAQLAPEGVGDQRRPRPIGIGRGDAEHADRVVGLGSDRGRQLLGCPGVVELLGRPLGDLAHRGVHRQLGWGERHQRGGCIHRRLDHAERLRRGVGDRRRPAARREEPHGQAEHRGDGDDRPPTLQHPQVVIQLHDNSTTTTRLRRQDSTNGRLASMLSAGKPYRSPPRVTWHGSRRLEDSSRGRRTLFRRGPTANQPQEGAQPTRVRPHVGVRGSRRRRRGSERGRACWLAACRRPLAGGLRRPRGGRHGKSPAMDLGRARRRGRRDGFRGDTGRGRARGHGPRDRRLHTASPLAAPRRAGGGDRRAGPPAD